MRRAPSHREREVLRYLAAGMRLERTGQLVCHVVAKGVRVTMLRASTVKMMQAAGWIGEDPQRGLFLTIRGRDVAECKTFVRAFSESTSLSTSNSQPL